MVILEVVRVLTSETGDTEAKRISGKYEIDFERQTPRRFVRRKTPRQKTPAAAVHVTSPDLSRTRKLEIHMMDVYGLWRWAPMWAER
jgi:hypothetical protein